MYFSQLSLIMCKMCERVHACACTCVCSLKMFKHNSQCTTPITTDVTPAFWQMWYFLESGAPERDGCNYTPRTKDYGTAAIQTEVMHSCMCVGGGGWGGGVHIMCICVFVLDIYIHAIFFLKISFHSHCCILCPVLNPFPWFTIHLTVFKAYHCRFSTYAGNA